MHQGLGTESACGCFPANSDAVVPGSNRPGMLATAAMQSRNYVAGTVHTSLCVPHTFSVLSSCLGWLCSLFQEESASVETTANAQLVAVKHVGKVSTVTGHRWPEERSDAPASAHQPRWHELQRLLNLWKEPSKDWEQSSSGLHSPGAVGMLLWFGTGKGSSGLPNRPGTLDWSQEP